MECPNCTFQNIPGTRACVRCATMLDLSGVGIDPPRASSGRLARRARATTVETRRRFLAGASGLARQLRLPQLDRVGVLSLVQCIVPGLPQMRSEIPAMRILGRAILAAWAAALVLALLTIGSGISVLLCFAAMSIHCMSFTIVLAPEMQDSPLPTRVLLGISMYFAVMGLLYAPGYAAAQRIARIVPVQGVRTNPSVANGDVLLRTATWTRPERFERGDVVMCEFVRGYGAPGLTVAQGYSVDRIVAVGGDEVVVSNGVLKVNGEVPPEALLPLGGVAGLPNCTLNVAEGQVVVFPTILQISGTLYARPGLLVQMSLVSEDAVLGRVFFRVRPWMRMGVPAGMARGAAAGGSP